MNHIKLASVNERFGLPGPVIAYSPAIAHALGGDVCAALLFCQFWYWSAGGTKRFCRTAKFIEHTLGLTAVRQKRARDELRRRGWIVETPQRRAGKSYVWTHLVTGKVAPDLRAWLEERRIEAEAAAAEADDEWPMDPTTDDPEYVDRTTTETGIPEDPIQDPERTNIKTRERDACGPLQPDLLTTANTEPGPRAEPEGPRLTASVPKITEEAILRGDLDHVPPAVKCSRVVLAVLLAAIGREWHTKGTVVVASVRRQQAWVKHIKVGGLPSVALKGIFGMRHDTWAERGDHGCDIGGLVANPERWLKLYEEHHLRGALPRWPRKGIAVPPGFKPWKGIVIPADMEPDHGMALSLEAGNVFVIDERAWVDPLTDRRGFLAKHMAKYGDVNVTEAARARLAAKDRPHV